MSLKNTGNILNAGNDIHKLVNIAKTYDSIEDAALGINQAADAVADLTKEGKNVGTLGNAFTGLVNFIKPLLPAIAAVGAAFAAYKIYDALTLSYGEARENLDTSSANYSNTTEEIETLNSQLETTRSRIEELKALKDAGAITFAQEVELGNLERQNTSLEKQLEIRQKLSDIESKEQADAAKTALEYKSEKIIETDKNGIALTHNDGEVKTKQVDRFDYLDDQMRQYELARENVEKAQDAFSKAEKDYKNKDISKKQFEQFKANLKNNEKAVTEYESNISSMLKELDGDVALLYDSNGKLTDEADQGLVDRFNKINDAFNGIDLSPAEKNLNNLNDFFSSSSGNTMKEYLENIVKNGGTAQDALDAFRESGMRLKDIDVSEEGFLRYFEDVKNAAHEAEEALNHVDGSYEGVKKASESENKGANYDQTMGFFSKSKELDKNGLWGTDDFQSVAQFGVNYDIADKLKNNADAYTYASDAYKEAYEKSKPLLESWYGNKDELVNMQNVLNDFSSKGLARNLGDGEFSFTDENGDPLFKTTAEAANAFETSVDNVEVALGKLEEHGFEFDGIEKSGELIKEYKSALGGVKELRDSMDEGSEKDRLSTLIEGWDSEYEKYQGDLSQLSKEQIVEIKFEYDLATIQQKINELKEKAEATGSNEDWAGLTIAQKKKRELLESKTGYGRDSDEGYGSSHNKVDDLRASMKGQSEEARAEINTQISAIQDMQNAFQQFRLDGGELNWSDYLKTDQASTALESIMDSTQLTKEQLAELFGMDAKDLMMKVDADTSEAESKIDGIQSKDGNVITMDVDASTEQIEQQISSLKEGESVEFTANMDGVETEINAVKNKDGTITYTANIEGVEQPINAVKNEDGTVTYSADTTEIEDNFHSLPTHLELEVGLNKEKVEREMSTLEPHSTIQFSVDYEGLQRQVTALKHEDGTITYTAIIDGEPTEVELNKDGTISYSPETYEVDSYNAPDKPGTAPYHSDFSGVGSPPVLNGVVKYSAVISGAGTAANAAAKIIKDNTVNGTAHANGTAYASGNWGVPKNENALVGELGRETVVRNGEFHTVGDDGAEFTKLKAGDIVFNHRQTEELFKNGYVTSGGGRAKVVGDAYASGSAFASGGRLPIGGSGGNSYSSTSKKNSSSKKSSDSTPSSQKNSTASSKAAKEAENLIDWIAILLSRVARQTKIAVDTIDRATGLANKQSSTSNAISKVQNEIAQNQSAMSGYLNKANSVGLSGDLSSKVQNGSIEISNYDEDTQKKIKDYQEYYEKYLDCEDKIRDLQDQEIELAQRRLENVEEWYNAIVDINNALRDVVDSKMEYNDAIGLAIDNSENTSALKDAIKSQDDTYNQLVQKLTDYQSEFNSLVANGYIQKDSDAWLEGQKKINDFTSEIYKASSELINLQKQLDQIQLDKLQMLIDGFNRIVTKFDKYISLLESRDENVKESSYKKQLDNNNLQLEQLKEKRDKILYMQSFEDVGGKNYEDYAKQLSDIEEEALGLMETNEELKDSIFELRLTSFEDSISEFHDLRDEMDDFRSLLNEDALLDKNGIITEDGLANLALLQQQMGIAKQEIVDYRKALDKVQESFNNGVISEKEYNEKSKEYREGLRESIIDVKSYNDALTDLYITQLKTEVDVLNKVIDKRQEALDKKAAYYDYDKKLKSQTKDVDLLKAQIAALEGVNNASSQAELKRLKEQLKQSEEELSDTKRDHALDMQKEGYEGISSDMEKMLEDTEYEVAHNANKQQEIISSMLSNVVNMYESAYGKINQIIGDVGWIGSDGFNQNQSDLGDSNGVKDQNNSATDKPSNTKPTDIAGGIVTDPINDNSDFNHHFEDEIMQDPNTTNRLVAELKVSKFSVTLQEGQSTSVTATIRPTDAKNKTLDWKSSNTGIATVSFGTITAIKPGSCQVSVLTTDGSGIGQTIGIIVTKKPDPPKPAPPSNPGTADGVPRVGDPVTFSQGRYYYDSQGVRPSGNKMLGRTVYITKINTRSWATKPYHISTGGSLGNGDLGWLSLDQLRGYSSGSKGVHGNQWALTDEDGEEIIIDPKTGIQTPYGNVRHLNNGTSVIPHNLTENLYDWGAIKPSDYMSNAINNTFFPVLSANENSRDVNIHYDSLVSINGGTITKDSIPELEKVLKNNIPKMAKEISNYMYQDAQKTGIRKKR